MSNAAGLMISVTYIFLILGLAALFARLTKGSSEATRKLVHILVGNWVFITPYFTQFWAVVLVPFSFIIINYLSLKYKIFSAMEREDEGYGTVYYAVSMFVLSGAAYLLKWPTLSFVGLLAMAYGDGLAAVVGKKWGRHRPFSFAPDKSLEGSVTVAVLTFGITWVSVTLLAGAGALRAASPHAAALIAFTTALAAAFIELSGKNGCDNLTLPIGAGLFATLLLQFGDVGLYAYLAASIAILAVAFRRGAITADGAVAALLTALTLYALGGVWVGVSLLAFFVLGSFASGLKNSRKRAAEQLQADTGARNWKRVLANSLPASALVWVAYVGNEPRLILAAMTVFAAAAADTFSSELGMLSTGRVFSVLTGRPIERGLSGGVSLAGLGAGLLGSVLLSLLALPMFGWQGFLFSAAMGFAGSILDSVLGASLQVKFSGANGATQEMPAFAGAAPTAGLSVITNSAVNLLSLSVIASLAAIAYQATHFVG
jgi:uncharacterized protein (TIGR00297 family)